MIALKLMYGWKRTRLKEKHMYANKFEYAEFLQKKYGTPLLNKHIAAKELSISRATIDRMRKSGHIRSKSVGKQIRFHVLEISQIVMAGI